MYLQGKGKQLTENKKIKKVVDKPLKKCYNKYVRYREGVKNKQIKKIKKMLDKSYKKCYNNNVKKTN